jgi:DNA-3-methyladenine glycosylase II
LSGKKKSPAVSAASSAAGSRATAAPGGEAEPLLTAGLAPALAGESPPYWAAAKRHLARKDPVLAAIMRRHPRIAMTRRGEPFFTLARAIVGQQISVKAAATVWARFELAVLAGELRAASGVSPAAVLAASPEALRAAGLSQRKLEYLLDLASHFETGKVDPLHWPSLDDEALIAELVGVRGIGRWTAEMFLMFNLQRPDVLPLDDIGLQKAVAVHYYSGRRVTARTIRRLAKNWQPWRSVATWYLWRSLDPVPVEY